MNDLTNSSFSSCTHCPSIKFEMSQPGYGQPSWQQTDLEAGVFHNELFHGHCQKCEDPRWDPSNDSNVVLCASCKHLRLYHLLKCVLPAVDSVVRAIVTKLSPSEPKSCDFCRFCFHLYRSSSPDGNDERYGELLLSYHRRGSALFVHNFVHEAATRRWPISLCINDLVSRSHSFEASAATLPNKRYTKEICWPAMCSQLHTSSQSKGENVVQSGNNKRLVNVRVIDVDECCVTDLPVQSKYVALSYVWGTNQEEQLQLTTLNLAHLETAHSLSNVDLPRTIDDSMELCRRVGYKYLWVDRLCIVQDARTEHKTAQLDQMFAIYQQAEFTVITLAGDASYGLPGVSRPKPSRPRILAFDNFAIAERVLDFKYLRNKSRSKWDTRGWTFQEFQASNRCLYSTDHGFYYVADPTTDTDGGLMKFYEEATNSYTFHPAWRAQQLSYANMVSSYTVRNLTYPRDILHAFSGVLYQMYATRTSFGLPWGDFDRALLWRTRLHNSVLIEPSEADAFPSWSWASSVGSKTYPQSTQRPIGLAFWGKVVCDATSATPYVDVAVPSETDMTVSDASHIPGTAKTNSAFGHVLAGLAWWAGCLIANMPLDIRVNCPRAEYTRRLELRWPDCTSYWQDAFATCQPKSVFTNADIELGTPLGRLIGHTQKASLKVEQRTKQPSARYWIRNAAGRLTGMFEYDSTPVAETSVTELEFIVLSATDEDLGYWINRPEGFGIPISKLLGCQCRTEKYNVDEVRPNIQHIEECPHHADFRSPVAHIPGTEDRPAHEVCNKIFLRHFAAVSYFDANGELMHYWDRVPRLNVMMIVPSTGKGQGQGVYQRAGLGWVYLKRWVEANPKFETVVLE